MAKVAQEDIIQVIKKEIEWHKNNPSTDLTEKEREMFIKGLEQVLILIEEMQKAIN